MLSSFLRLAIPLALTISVGVLTASPLHAQEAGMSRREKKAVAKAAEEAKSTAAAEAAVVIPDPSSRRPSEYRCIKRATATADSEFAYFKADTFEEARAKAAAQFGGVANLLGCRDVQGLSGAARDVLPPPIPDSATEMPFQRLTLGDYFDAIYNRDVGEIRRLDAKYLERLLRYMRSAQSDRGIAGRLMASTDTSKATLLVPVIKTYVRNYGKSFESCLRREAVSYTVRRTVTTQYSTQSQDFVYRMNPEFTAAYNDTKPKEGEVDVGLQNATDLADQMSGGAISRAEGATRSLMGQYRCNDPRIRRFEARLLEMYSVVAK